MLIWVSTGSLAISTAILQSTLCAVAVARRAGVSIATVSRVLNGLPVVTENAAKRAQAAITELGYQRLPRQRGLVTHPRIFAMPANARLGTCCNATAVPSHVAAYVAGSACLRLTETPLVE